MQILLNNFDTYYTAYIYIYCNCRCKYILLLSYRQKGCDRIRIYNLLFSNICNRILFTNPFSHSAPISQQKKKITHALQPYIAHSFVRANYMQIHQFSLNTFFSCAPEICVTHIKFQIFAGK